MSNPDYLAKSRRPDLIAIDTKKRTCKIADFEVPGDNRFEQKQKDKIEKYPDYLSHFGM